MPSHLAHCINQACPRTLLLSFLIRNSIIFQVRRLSGPNVLVDKKNLKSQGQAAQNIAIIIILFVISWIPLYTINTVACFCTVGCTIPQWLFDCCIILSHLNSVWNPVLYAWGMRDFREALKRLFRITSQDNFISKLVIHPSNSGSHNNMINQLVQKTVV